MARYSKILLGPARKNDPQVREAEAGAAILPGSLIVLDANGRFVLAGATTVGKVWLAQENYLAQENVDTAYTAYSAGPPVVRGSRVMGLELQDDVMYAARVADGVNITAPGTALTPAAGGTLGIAATGDLVVAYSEEAYNNNTGASQLVHIRPSGSTSYLSASA